jgi:hypothetical protein
MDGLGMSPLSSLKSKFQLVTPFTVVGQLDFPLLVLVNLPSNFPKTAINAANVAAKCSDCQ